MDRLSRKFNREPQDNIPVAPQQTNQQQSQQPARRVLVGTPCYDGRIEVWYANSLIQTIRLGLQLGVEILPIWLSYDALIQRARNDLMGLMVETGCDDIIFIDSDIEWTPEDFFRLLSHPVDVVGGTYPKKGELEQYVAKILDPKKPFDPITGLLHVDGLGTGFLRMSKRAVQYLWDTSTPYEEKDQGKIRRWIFDVEIQNGEIVSEDILVCQKLNQAGISVWLDTTITCSHVGTKKFQGNFAAWFQQLRSSNGQMLKPTGYGLGATPPNIKSLYE
jgi:hypothetical protein